MEEKMRVFSFLVIFFAAICFLQYGCNNSDQNTGTDTETSTTEQMKEDSSQTAEGVGQEIEDIAEDVVEKSEEMHQEQLEEFNKKAPPELAAELWNLINTEGYQEHWKEWQSEEGNETNAKVYVNDLAYNALEKKEKELPPGSIVVENNYNDKNELETVEALINLGGDDPQGRWFRAEYSPDGNPISTERRSSGIEE
jgi:predicted small secreted protein